jgi:hypothetical protein
MVPFTIFTATGGGGHGGSFSILSVIPSECLTGCAVVEPKGSILFLPQCAVQSHL